jgi:phosphoribosyl 1,2-cyclic phosphodiesterase
MVDAPDSKSGTARCVGSSPTSGTSFLYAYSPGGCKSHAKSARYIAAILITDCHGDRILGIQMKGSSIDRR